MDLTEAWVIQPSVPKKGPVSYGKGVLAASWRFMVLLGCYKNFL